MNIFFRFCVFEVLSIISQIITAQVFTLEQILSSLKGHHSTLTNADPRQASFQVARKTANAYPNSGLEIYGCTFSRYLISDRQMP